MLEIVRSSRHTKLQLAWKYLQFKIRHIFRISAKRKNRLASA